MPFVGRLAYEAMRDRALAAEQRERDLLDRYHALKAQGQQVARVAQLPAPRLPEPDPEQRAVEAHERAFLENATQDFVRAGKSEAEARQLAEQIRGAVAFADSPVPFGH